VAHKQVDDGNLSPAFIIIVLVNTVRITPVSHCSLNFEAPRLGYGILSIILVLENCKFKSLKVLEKSLNFVLWVSYEPCGMLSVGELVKWLWTDWRWVGECGGQDMSRSLSASVTAVPARKSTTDQHSHGTKADIHRSEFCAIRTLRQVSCPWFKWIKHEIVVTGGCHLNSYCCTSFCSYYWIINCVERFHMTRFLFSLSGLLLHKVLFSLCVLHLRTCDFLEHRSSFGLMHSVSCHSQ